MKNLSIFYTITFIFILSTTSTALAFLWLMNYDKQNYSNELNTKYSIISSATLFKMAGLITQKEYENRIKDFNIKILDDEDKKDDVIKNGEILEEIEIDIGSSAIILYKKNHFLKINQNKDVLVIQDGDYQQYRYDIIKVIFAIVFLINIISYIFIIRKIKPLRKLKRQIDKFASGNLNILNTSTGKDEISVVAQAFYDAVMQIKKLNESRQLFLRNIMHELKTPITKGRIVVEMIEDSKNKTRLIGVFTKLEELINEFSTLERATSGIMIDEVSQCFLQDLIGEATNLAMCGSDLVENNSKNIQIYVQKKLFVIAIKNLIDNGVKYSTDQKIKIYLENNNLEFHTTGKKLQKDFSYYIEPFTKGKNAFESFGLGLYIVDNIIKSHSMKFCYRYEDGVNIFSFDGIDKILVKTNNDLNLNIIDKVL
ncbi:HAMP domain-containing histidine kinase [Campylobacter sp. FMV-PI01]|uniref:histidine kinase n=1 Tax=Campylobacter portucalensis TaxID=2608384 RepID=A0A6L5WJS8_9BACT|nr:ArsS family sensor histidine kinase [Campylobacter portucalensis]MSN96001.1 HAMP domain-containing histidine kinase [Campylobacter portucalensis]